MTLASADYNRGCVAWRNGSMASISAENLMKTKINIWPVINENRKRNVAMISMSIISANENNQRK
jgi:hypothetical protein